MRSSKIDRNVCVTHKAELLVAGETYQPFIITLSYYYHIARSGYVTQELPDKLLHYSPSILRSAELT